MTTLEKIRRRWRRLDPNWLEIIIITNLAGFAISMAVSMWFNKTIPSLQPQKVSFFSGFAPNSEALLFCGANSAWHVSIGQFWRLFCGTVLHGGLVHLLVNGYSFLNLGRLCLPILGGRKFLAVYLGSGLSGSLLSFAWHYLSLGSDRLISEAPIEIGASGAICGLLGFLLGHLRKETTGVGGMVKRQLLFWLAILLLFGFTYPGISNSAHIGGLVFGFVFAVLQSRPSRQKALRFVEGSLFSGVLAAGFVISIAASLFFATLGDGKDFRSYILLRGPVHSLLWITNDGVKKPQTESGRIEKIEEGLDVLKTEPFDASQIVQGVARFWEIAMDNQEIPGTLPLEGLAAKQRYDQIVGNLLRQLGILSGLVVTSPTAPR
ncbi:MAG: rhomboid family intramembrane serine protease [Planctomycetota bacterium]